MAYSVLNNQELFLDDLKDEILLKIFMYFRPKYLGRFRQVSKRFNKITKDERLWRNITIWNKFSRKISADFFTQAMDYGLENLELRKCEVKGVMKRPERNQLKSLNLQVNLCQKLLFLHQLTHNMTTDCSLNYKFIT